LLEWQAKSCHSLTYVCPLVCPPQVEELESELESSQRQAGRYKSKVSALTEEVATLEEVVARERAQATRLRQQLAEAEHLQELSRQPPHLLGAHARHASAADLAASTEAANVQLRQLHQQVRNGHAMCIAWL
jgi:predicted RNase H-like nuclease (RuvC/YqgF family)